MTQEDHQNQLRKELKKLGDIPYEAAAEYERNQEELISEFSSLISQQDKEGHIQALENITSEELIVIHRDHTRYMSSIFKLNYAEIFLSTLPWIYRISKFRGIPLDYFMKVYEGWIEVINKHLEPHLAKPLVDVYQWLIDNHELIVRVSESSSTIPVEIEDSWKEVQQRFLAALLEGDHRECLRIADQRVKSGEQLENLYLQVIKISLYKIGFMWEEGSISVAHEHLATSIISRVMANLYPKFILLEHTKEKAVITAAPNEFHEVGARMVADLLEKDGWNVHYLGANLPIKELIDILLRDPPFLLGISAAMPFNLEGVIDMIKEIRQREELKHVKILVGGKIFLETPGLWELTGADKYAVDAKDAVRKASLLLEGKS